MLSVNLINRLFQTGQYGRLLDRLVHNGLDVPLPLRIRLERSSASAIALGLRRLVQLTWLPTGLSTRMFDHLLTAQQADGTIDDDVLATAAFVAAALALPLKRTESSTVSETAVQLAISSLAAAQGDDGLLADEGDRTQEDRALTSAFVLFLLAEHDAFRQATRFWELLNWFEEHFDDLDEATQRLWLMARTDATSAGCPPVATAA